MSSHKIWLWYVCRLFAVAWYVLCWHICWCVVYECELMHEMRCKINVCKECLQWKLGFKMNMFKCVLVFFGWEGTKQSRGLKCNIGFRWMPWMLDFGWKQFFFYWRVWRLRHTGMMHEWYVMICHNGWVWCESGASMIDARWMVVICHDGYNEMHSSMIEQSDMINA
jgi:hypothetical protein